MRSSIHIIDFDFHGNTCFHTIAAAPTLLLWLSGACRLGIVTLALSMQCTLSGTRRSKLAQVWYAYELQRRHPELIVPVLHPGVIDTQLFYSDSR